MLESIPWTILGLFWSVASVEGLVIILYEVSFHTTGWMICWWNETANVFILQNRVFRAQERHHFWLSSRLYIQNLPDSVIEVVSIDVHSHQPASEWAERENKSNSMIGRKRERAKTTLGFVVCSTCSEHETVSCSACQSINTTESTPERPSQQTGKPSNGWIRKQIGKTWEVSLQNYNNKTLLIRLPRRQWS